MDTLVRIAAFIGTVAGILSLIGIFIVYIKGTYNKEVSAALRQDLADEKSRRIELEKTLKKFINGSNP